MRTGLKVWLFYFTPITVGLGVFAACMTMLVYGCQHYSVDNTKDMYVFYGGVEGTSNDPVRFTKPLITLKRQFPLEVGSFAVRLDSYLIRDQFVLHQIVSSNKDGTYVMQGFNRKTNPLPDKNLLTTKNYYGTALPIASSK